MSPTANQTVQVWCSFCGKSNTDVDKLVAGPGVQICNRSKYTSGGRRLFERAKVSGRAELNLSTKRLNQSANDASSR